MKCDRVPAGYHCDLDAGHDGPCPAWPCCPHCGDWKQILTNQRTDDGTRYCPRCDYVWMIWYDR